MTEEENSRIDSFRKTEDTAKNEKSGDLPAIISIGVVLDAREGRAFDLAELLVKDLEKDLMLAFPDFNWAFRLIQRHDFPRQIPRDPLMLLEFGSDIKIEYGFDFVIVFTTMPLKSRFEQAANAVPSNLLETVVISMSRILENHDESSARKVMIILAKHVLGHLWGLDHNQDTVMQPHKFWSADGPSDWNKDEKEQIREYLSGIADPRLEEIANGRKSRWLFYLQVLFRERWSLMRDIFLFRTLFMMLQLGRFTAATVASMIFLFLTAEAWEMGAAIRSWWLDFALVGVILIAALSIYFGQNLQEIGRSDRLMEQTVRSRIVLSGTLIVGMAAYWTSLFIISALIIFLLPDKVLCSWAGIPGNSIPVIHYAKLMATFGVFASAVGGNLEEEDNIKAVLVYAEET